MANHHQKHLKSSVTTMCSYETLKKFISYVDESVQCSYKSVQVCISEFFLKNEILSNDEPFYLEGLLNFHVARYYEVIDSFLLPQSVRYLCEQEYVRISKTCLIGSDTKYYAKKNDLYLKDLGIVRFKLIPFGAELADLSSGVPRSILFKGGIQQFIKGLFYFVFITRGFKPFLQLHLDPRNLKEFTQNGWCETYLRLANFLAMNRQYKGFFGASWFYDPALDFVSPHLSYLRKVRQSGGARIFKWGSGDEVKGMAIGSSSTRRKFYDLGKYIPCSYFIVWGRKDLLAWARNHKKKME